MYRIYVTNTFQVTYLQQIESEVNNVRTVTQVAEELSISRKRVYALIERLNIETTKDGRNNFIDDERFEIIKNEVKGTDGNVLKERLNNVLERDRYVAGNKISDREYTDLKERIASLEQQIGIKDQQILAKDEQLQAKDYQINGLIQSNLNITKALNPPISEVASTSIEEVPKKSFWDKIFKKD